MRIAPNSILLLLVLMFLLLLLLPPLTAYARKAHEIKKGKKEKCEQTTRTTMKVAAKHHMQTSIKWQEPARGAAPKGRGSKTTNTYLRWKESFSETR